MASPNFFYASAPVVGLPPTQTNQYFSNNHYASTNGQTTAAISNPFTSNGSIPPTPGSLAGRKRSRGDIHASDEEDEQFEDGSRVTPVDEKQSDPHEMHMWAEGLAERKTFELSHTKRPSVSSRKSQRRVEAGASGSQDLAQLVLPPQMREATAEPLIDEATRVLGISWTRMDATECLRISQAAYSKWIQNHYPGVKNVTVWFENSAIPGYLVEAHNAYNGQQGFYIFSNDLTEARLCTTEATQLVPRLKMLPALHLAAPGGHIRAESDPITAAENELNAVQVNTAADGVTQFSHEVSQLRGRIQDHAYPRGQSVEPQEPNGMCSAHEMDLD